MGKKQERTTKSQIRSALRMLFLRSREHAACKKRDKNTCQECGKKGSQAKGREVKIEIHHIENIRWDMIIDYIYRHLLVDPKDLICLCKECHAKETKNQRDNPAT
jgi:5-methylcytosine-specific restriction endonuclease McrA